MNIGVHLFDLLTSLFGACEHAEVHTSRRDKVSGLLELEHATVRWYLSIDERDLPESVRARGEHSYRVLAIDGEEIDLTASFADLHTRVYEDILSGGGVGIADVRPSLELVHRIRMCEPRPSLEVGPALGRRRQGGGRPYHRFARTGSWPDRAARQLAPAVWPCGTRVQPPRRAPAGRQRSQRYPRVRGPSRRRGRPRRLRPGKRAPSRGRSATAAPGCESRARRRERAPRPHRTGRARDRPPRSRWSRSGPTSGHGCSHGPRGSRASKLDGSRHLIAAGEGRAGQRMVDVGHRNQVGVVGGSGGREVDGLRDRQRLGRAPLGFDGR